MNIYIYDIEVYAYDWIVVAKNIETKGYTVIHNDNYHLKAFLDQEDYILGGFNNKHYDDYVVNTMYNGGSTIEVKKHNDFIIGGGTPWEYPFIQFKKKPFKSFDLRDDIADPGISLKAIEGNLRLPIVESSVDFNIDRPLTPEELEEVIKYCKYDVDSTERLYYERKKDYIDAKLLVGDMYGVDPKDSLGMTNARLSALVLEAKKVDRKDERDYVIPDNIDLDLIPKVVLDFFLQIRDKSIPDAKLFGAGKGQKGLTLRLIIKTEVGECPVTYAWGGVHGAKPCVTIENTETRVIVNQDVGSLYPNSMLNFGYCSRSMKDPEAYRKIVEKRLGYKSQVKKYGKEIAKILGDNWRKKFSDLDEDGLPVFSMDKAKANTDEETYKKIVNYFDYDAKQASLKLVINTVYGAMLAMNDLADRWAGRSVCISNQLAMTMLIVQLAKSCKSIDFVNINTDGVMYTIDISEVDLADQIVASWCAITKFEMEKDDFIKVIQKDVNNYIGITPDGKFKTKGGYVSLYKGGNFKTNSLSIIHKAVVEYLVNGVKPETTINECKDVFAFQQIIKTGGTFEGSYQYINGERISIQKVNRIYAVKDPKYGQVVKGKWITEKRRKDKATGKMISEPVDPPKWSETIISECPDHAYIDNENKLTVEDLDKDYYIDLAKKRIDKYINIDRKVENEINKIKEVVEIMATKKEETIHVTEEEHKELRNLNIYGKLIIARNNFLKAPKKKSGVNRYAEFEYFELEDIVPVATGIFSHLGLVLIPTIDFNEAKATLINADNPEERIVFIAPAKDPNIQDGTKMSAIQGLGAYITYMRRYLYMLVLDIVEADPVDATIAKETNEQKADKPKSNKPATPEKREEIKKDLIDESGEATETQIKAIKAGLKKLRAKDESYEGYIKENVAKIKGGLLKADAEALLIEIGEKVNE